MYNRRDFAKAVATAVGVAMVPFGSVVAKEPEPKPSSTFKWMGVEFDKDTWKCVGDALDTLNEGFKESTKKTKEFKEEMESYYYQTIPTKGPMIVDGFGFDIDGYPITDWRVKHFEHKDSYHSLPYVAITFERDTSHIGPDGTIYQRETQEFVVATTNNFYGYSDDAALEILHCLNGDEKLEDLIHKGIHVSHCNYRIEHTPFDIDHQSTYLVGYNLEPGKCQFKLGYGQDGLITYEYIVDSSKMSEWESVEHMKEKVLNQDWYDSIYVREGIELEEYQKKVDDYYAPCKIASISYGVKA